MCTYVTCSESLHDRIQRFERQFISSRGAQDPNEQTASYSRGRELNLRRLREMTIKTGASTETVTTAVMITILYTSHGTRFTLTLTVSDVLWSEMFGLENFDQGHGIHTIVISEHFFEIFTFQIS